MRTPAIREWSEDDRPREKLLKLGEAALSNAELLAIILRTGVKGRNVLDLSRGLFHEFRSFGAMSRADISRWRSIKGLGDAKICQIKAALEIGRRLQQEFVQNPSNKISCAKDAANFLMPVMRDLGKEVVKILLLDSQNRLIESFDAAQGTVNFAVPILREIFQKALQHQTVALIAVHNHPSGDVRPSSDDRLFTKRLREAGDVMQIKVLDHVIIGYECFYSFREAEGW